MKWWLLGWVLFLPLLEGSPLELEVAPGDHIYDPSGLLDQDFRSSISRRIKHELNNENLEVYLVLFEEEPREGARALAKAAAQNWVRTNYWAVVYQVGFDGEPEAATGGAMMDRLRMQAIEGSLEAAAAAGAMVDGRQGRLEEYVNTLTNQFGYLRVVAKKVETEVYQKHREKAVARAAARKRSILLAGLGALALLAIGIIAFAYQRRSKKREKKSVTFPEFETQMRLAGPHTGGSSVLVRFGTSSHSG